MKYQKILDSISNSEIADAAIESIIFDLNPDDLTENENSILLETLKTKRAPLYRILLLKTASEYM